MAHGLHVTEHNPWAAGLPVVLVHGAPDRSKNFAGVLGFLDDVHIVTYDRRGYGKSMLVQPPARNFGDHAADLIAVLDAVLPGRRVVGAAQSVGCNVLMTAATKAPERFAAIGVWEPPNAWCDWWPDPSLAETATAYANAVDTDALGEEFNRGILGDERWETLPERTREMLRTEGAAFKTDMAAEIVAPYDFADYRTPTVIGYGTQTRSGHEEGARRLAKVIGADLYEVKGADHFAPISDPAAWATMVRKAIALAAAPG